MTFDWHGKHRQSHRLQAELVPFAKERRPGTLLTGADLKSTQGAERMVWKAFDPPLQDCPCFMARKSVSPPSWNGGDSLDFNLSRCDEVH
jgi:hypothetical protein